MSYSTRNDIIHNKEIFVILHFEIKSSSPKDKLLIILVVTLYYCIGTRKHPWVKLLFLHFLYIYLYFTPSQIEKHIVLVHHDQI